MKKHEENVDSDIESHNHENESISGTEMKQLYEKYCFLNEYLERKIDDPDNIKLLKMRGFKISTRENK